MKSDVEELVFNLLFQFCFVIPFAFSAVFSVSSLFTMHCVHLLVLVLVQWIGYICQFFYSIK